MTDETKMELLTDLFELEEGELNPNSELNNLDNWDSLTKLSLIILFRDECGKKLTGDEIKAFETVKDIMNAME